MVQWESKSLREDLLLLIKSQRVKAEGDSIYQQLQLLVFTCVTCLCYDQAPLSVKRAYDQKII